MFAESSRKLILIAFALIQFGPMQSVYVCVRARACVCMYVCLFVRVRSCACV